MRRIVATFVIALLLAGAAYTYHRITIGVIGPDEIEPDVLGLTPVEIYEKLGRPRTLDQLGSRVQQAFWLGRKPYSWNYSIWFVDGFAAQIEMPNDMIGLDLVDLTQRLDASADWAIVPILSSGGVLFDAWMNKNQSIVVYDSGHAYVVANDHSIFWEKSEITN
jgi:hypothetical protein